jgi:hypothetical protein
LVESRPAYQRKKNACQVALAQVVDLDRISEKLEKHDKQFTRISEKLDDHVDPGKS